MKVLSYRLERAITKSVLKNFPYKWCENTITGNLLDDLRLELNNVKIQGNGFKTNIDWEIYQLSGTEEHYYGDVAFIVNITYRNGENLEGVAFLEAKRRDRNKTTFSAMNVPQMNRILKYSPRAQYLLYDYEDITSFQFSEDLLSEHHHFYDDDHIFPFTAKTNVVCVPLNIAKNTKQKNTSLYKHSMPFSHLLTTRYFRGFDLEFDEVSKKIATGYLDKHGLPKFVLRVNIVENGVELKKDTLNINQNKFKKLEL